MTLTKEQKMAMVEAAIDAGMRIEITKHKTSYDEAQDLAEIFTAHGLPVVYKNIEKDLATLQINENGYLRGDKFEGTIFM